MKVNIKLDNNWLEATWIEDEIQIHCEAFSGHPEHIAMLEAKALEFGTNLDEYVELITQAKEAFVMPTAEELLAYELDQKIQEAKIYLTSTAWYIERLNDPSSGKEIPEEVLSKRGEARELIHTLEAELGVL